MSTSSSPLLSASQLAVLAELGEERSEPVGKLLSWIGDRVYPFVAIYRAGVWR